VLYLAAEQDLDRRVAVSKGFAANNMIAVDARKSVVDKLRSETKLAIHGRMEDVAPLYPGANVVHVDFCCGLTDLVAKAANRIVLSGHHPKGAVFLFNLQRGREHGKGRSYIRATQQALLDEYGLQLKNRAELLFFLIFSYLVDVRASNGQLDLSSDSIKSTRELNSFKELIFSIFRPFIVSYKSAAGRGLYFDTLIITNPFSPFNAGDLRREYMEGKKFQALSKKVAAIKAVQTMRKAGTLPPCSNF
jgi:hypothetical protein